MDSTNINVRKFSWDQLRRSDRRCPVIACVGKRQIGKTELLFSFLKHLPETYNRQGLILGLPEMRCTEQQCEFIRQRPTLELGKTVGLSDNQDTDLELEQASNLLEEQRNSVMNWSKLCQQEPDTYSRWDMDRPQRLLALCDHCDLNKWGKSQLLRDITMNGSRHLWTTVFLEMQYPAAIPPNVRANIDYVFIFKNTFCSRRIYDMYAGIFPSYNAFCAVLDQVTGNMSDYSCLVIDNTSCSDKLEDRVYWFNVDIDQTYQPTDPISVPTPTLVPTPVPVLETISVPIRHTTGTIISADGSIRESNINEPSEPVEESWLDWTLRQISPLTGCFGPYNRQQPNSDHSC